MMINRKRRASGFTLVEALIAVTILSVIIGIIGRFMISTQKNQSYIFVQNTIKSELERSLFQVSKQLNQNRLLLGNPVAGDLDYRSRMDFTDIPGPIAGTTLPTIRDTGSLAVEKNCLDYPNNFYRSNAFGNALMFVKYTSRFDGATLSNQNHARQLDIYEFKFFYITEQSTNPPKIDRWNNPATLNGQRLMEWTSVKYVDATQLRSYLEGLTNNLTAADATTVRTALISNNINFAWDKNAANLNSAFFNVSGSGITLTANAAHVIPRQSLRNALLLKSDQQNTYSVAYNTLKDPSSPYNFPLRMQVPKYYDFNVPACSGVTPVPLPAAGTTINQDTGIFPRGFEVGVVGPASGRSIVLHLSMVGIGNYDNTVEHGHTVVAYAKDR